MSEAIEPIDLVAESLEPDRPHLEIVTSPIRAVRPAGAPRSDLASLVVKRVIDIVAAAVLVLLAMPVVMLSALAIKLTSPGPVFHAQIRVGLNGRTFRMRKMRSMYIGAPPREALWDQNEVGGGVLFKIRRDPRVTPVGRLIRRLSIDELPQLLNVLGGSMSLVGPRPHFEVDVAKYDDVERGRLLVKPGITGLAQINGRSDLSWTESLDFDLRYAESWSVGRDITIIARTAWAVLRSRGAY